MRTRENFIPSPILCIPLVYRVHGQVQIQRNSIYHIIQKYFSPFLFRKLLLIQHTKLQYVLIIINQLNQNIEKGSQMSVRKHKSLKRIIHHRQ